MGFVLKNIGSSNGIFLMLSASFIQCIFIISWTPNVENSYVIYLMMVCFAFSQSMASGQVRALYGVYIQNNPTAFSFCAISQTIGLFLGSMFSAYFCTYIKVYIFIGIILTSLICYIILLIHNKKDNLVEKMSLLEGKQIHDDDTNIEKNIESF